MRPTGCRARAARKGPHTCSHSEPSRESTVGLPACFLLAIGLAQQPHSSWASAWPDPALPPACWKVPLLKGRGLGAAAGCPTLPAGPRGLWSWGRGRWARCIPVFFAELGVGFSDIQAFTEHCFTIAGTKRENRVTPTAPAGAREPDLHAPELGAAHLAPGQGTQMPGDIRQESAGP